MGKVRESLTFYSNININRHSNKHSNINRHSNKHININRHQC